MASRLPPENIPNLVPKAFLVAGFVRARVRGKRIRLPQTGCEQGQASFQLSNSANASLACAGCAQFSMTIRPSGPILLSIVIIKMVLAPRNADGASLSGIARMSCRRSEERRVGKEGR